MVGELSTGLARNAVETAGGASLALAAGALLVRRAGAVRGICLAQIVATGCAILVRAGASGQLILGAIAVALIGGKAAAIWVALARGKAEPAPPVAGVGAMAIAATLVLVAMFAAHQISGLTGALASNDVAMILGLVLVGPLIVVARPVAPWTMAGLLSVETGAALAAIATAPGSAIVESVAALIGLAVIAMAHRFERDVVGGA